jgi:RNA polymerase sigma factor (sigma-70 family)
MSLSALLDNLLRRWRRRSPDQPDAAEDARLLERFVADRDPLAFEVLVWRHGVLVLGVCRRLLRQRCDVEDVFQATFLTLIRKAASIRQGQSLAGWLYQVAYRIALRLRTKSLRRRVETLTKEPPAQSPDCILDEDMRCILDEEVHRLPEKYRLPVMLCYLQGLTTAEAAVRLGCRRGTLLSRLAWARRRLMSRFMQRGITPSAALAILATTRTTPAAMLVTSVVQTGLRYAAGGAVTSQVAALVQGVVQSMFVNKLQWAIAIVMVLCVGGTGLSWWAFRGKDDDSQRSRAVAADDPQENANADKTRDRPKEGKSSSADEMKREQRIEETVKELRNLEADADAEERRASGIRIDLQVKFLEAQEQYQRVEREVRQERDEIQNERRKIQKQMDEVDRTVGPREALPLRARLEKQAEELRDKERALKSVTKYRLAMLKAEEELRLADRRADFSRARMASRIEDATIRLREARGGSAAAPDWHILERKLDRLQRDIDELRRALRSARKE